MIMLRILIALSIASAGAASSPAWAQGSVPVQPLSTAVDTAAPQADAPITPKDHLEVTVFREPDLSVADVMVDESGHVALPLVGSFMAAAICGR